MLTPQYLSGVPDEFMERLAEAEQKIIELLASRIKAAGELIPSAEWQYWRLWLLNESYDVILNELMRLTNLSRKTLEHIFRRAGITALSWDDKIYRAAGMDPGPVKGSPVLDSIVAASYAQTCGAFVNLARTTALASQRRFIEILDSAVLQIQSGAMDYRHVITQSIQELSRDGLQSILYPSGRVDTLEVATRRAIVTGVNQMALKLSDARAEEMGADLVETTAHAGARPSHAEWQGKIFSREGKAKGYPNFADSTGYGTGEGLGGWNCRHSYFPYYPNIAGSAYPRAELEALNSATVTYNGKTISRYDAEQKQRRMEREIRACKREEAALSAQGLPTDEVKAKLRKRRARLRDFAAQTGLKRDYSREKI